MMFAKEELDLLEEGLHRLKVDCIQQIDWSQKTKNPPEGYEQEQRLKLEQVRELISRIK